MTTTFLTPHPSSLHGRSLHRRSRQTLTASAVQRLLARVGDRAATNLARVNASLEADRRAALHELRASRRRTLHAAEEERRRLERDLHDGTQQRLIALRIRLGLAAELVTQEPQLSGHSHMLQELAGEAQGALDELRNLVHHVHPPLLTHQGLIPALRAALDGAPIPTRLYSVGVGRLAPDIEAAVYFTCLEAVQNALKHAGPGATVTIRLRRRRGQLRFAVHDTGRGFDASREPSPRGDGLAHMRDRVGALGGELQIRSAPTRGTTVAGSAPAIRMPA